MTDTTRLAALAEEGLVLAVALALPTVGVAAVIGIVVGLIQTATGLHDPSIPHLPRLVVVALVLALTAPWIGAQLAAFATRALAGG